MRYFAFCCLVLSLGCSNLKQYDPNVLIDGQPALTMEASQGGQGHISIKQSPTGTEIEIVQFGMSDILGGTIGKIFSVVGGVFGGSVPPEIVINMPGAYAPDGQGNTDAETVR